MSKRSGLGLVSMRVLWSFHGGLGGVNGLQRRLGRAVREGGQVGDQVFGAGGLDGEIGWLGVWCWGLGR